MRITTHNPNMPESLKPEQERQRIVVARHVAMTDFFGDVVVTWRFWQAAMTVARHDGDQSRRLKILSLLHQLTRKQGRAATESSLVFAFDHAREGKQQRTWCRCHYECNDNGRRFRAIVDLCDAVNQLDGGETIAL